LGCRACASAFSSDARPHPIAIGLAIEPVVDERELRTGFRAFGFGGDDGFGGCCASSFLPSET
jgi:hypothetical protein